MERLTKEDMEELKNATVPALDYLCLFDRYDDLGRDLEETKEELRKIREDYLDKGEE